ncbi:MAG: hypothetical protein ACT4OO_05510 [Nitrospiraceae bacterium]
MDKGSPDLRQDIRDIHTTRTAIARKLEALEDHIQESVEDARSTVVGLVDHAKNAADQILDKTKYTFDPIRHINRHPWLMFGGALMLGYVVARLESKRFSSGVYPYYPPDVQHDKTSTMPTPTSATSSSARPVWAGLTDQISAEIEHGKAVLIDVGRTFVHEFFSAALMSLNQAFGKRSGEGSRRSPDRMI